MADERRREDERAAFATADDAARARWLVACLRAGDLLPERVRMAALAGDAAAAAALGAGAPRPLTSSIDGPETASWPALAWCAAAVGAARLALPVLAPDAATWGRAAIEGTALWLQGSADAPPAPPAEPWVTRDGDRVQPCRCCGVPGTAAELARSAVGLTLTMSAMSREDAPLRLLEVHRYVVAALELGQWERHASTEAHAAHAELRRRIAAAEQQLARRLKPLQRAVSRAGALGRGSHGPEVDHLREQTEAGHRAIAELAAEADRLAAPVPPFPGGSPREVVDLAARRELAGWALRPGSRFA